MVVSVRTPSSAARAGRDISSLRSTLDWLRSRNELLETDVPVNPDLEITGIQKTLDGSLPILFNNVVGYPHARAVTNLFANTDVMNGMFGWADDRERTAKLAHALTHPLPIEEIGQDAAPCQQEVITDDLDVNKHITAIRHTALETELTIGSGNSVVVGDYFHGGTHIGYNRMNFRWGNVGTFQASPGSHMWQVITAHYKDEKPIPLTMCFGVPPACTLVAGGGFDYVILPKGCDEIGVAGAIQGSPVNLVKARAVDPRLGSEADLEALVTAAHRRGIRVLMDYVINHVHEDHEYVDVHPEWFRTGCECGQPGCDWTTHRLDCSFHAYMPDVDWQEEAASEQMIADALWWLERFDLDGLRVDAVKHVEDLAIVNLSTRVHEAFEQGGTEYFLLGETAMGWAGDDLGANLPEYETIARYIGPFALSGQFDFVLYHATAYRVWADDARGMLHLDYWTRASHDHYPADAVMTPFVGSHDSERLISLAQYGSASAIVHHRRSSTPVKPGRSIHNPASITSA